MSLMDVVELKLHKTLIRTLIGQFWDIIYTLKGSDKNILNYGGTGLI